MKVTTGSFLSLILAATGLLVAQPAITEEVHKWIDSNGVTHYSDKAPEKRKSSVVPLIEPATSPPEKSVSTEAWKKKDSEFRQRQQVRDVADAKEREARRKQASATEARNQECVAARARLASLQANRRAPLYKRDPVSGQVFADFEARGVQIDELSKSIDAKCPPP